MGGGGGGVDGKRQETECLIIHVEKSGRRQEDIIYTAGRQLYIQQEDSYIQQKDSYIQQEEKFIKQETIIHTAGR